MPAIGAACNIGVENASGSCVVSSTRIPLVDASLDGSRPWPEQQALAGPRLLNPDGSVQPSASGTPVGPWPWIGAVVPGRAAARRCGTGPSPGGATHVRVAWLTGACVAAPREALLALGPFDPAIQLYAEDMDLGLRAARAGIPSCFCPTLARDPSRRRLDPLAFPAGGSRMAAGNRRAVVRRVYGPRPSKRAGWHSE